MHCTDVKSNRQKGNNFSVYGLSECQVRIGNRDN